MMGLSRITTLALVFWGVSAIEVGPSHRSTDVTGIEESTDVAVLQSPSVTTAPANLTASSATSSAVTLAWSGDAAGKVAVERKLLGAAWMVPTAAAPATAEKPTPSTIAVVASPTVTDGKIDAFATYVYRARTVGANNVLSAPSNELIVGPPPVGFTSVLAAPKAMQEHDASQFANQVRMTFDANGDPSIAYLTYDLNNDGELEDTDLSVISWNRAKYRWNAPVVIDTTGNVVHSGTRRPFMIARDASTGMFGILHMIGEHELRLSTSSDGGATWKHTRVERSSNEEPGFSTPGLAIAAGRVYAAYAAGNSVLYKSGLVTDAVSNWTSAKAPLLADAEETRAECVNVVLDDAGKPVVSYCMSAPAYNTIAAMWRPDAGKAVKIMDTNHKQNDDPGLDMIAVGSQIGVAMYAARDEQFFANHHMWFTRSTDGGATWSNPVVVEDDGGNAMNAPVTVMLDRAGHAAMVANMGGGNDGETRCGLPKLMRSADGVKWTTCAPETRGAPSTSDVAVPAGAFAGNDKLYVVFTARASAPGMPAGLVLWRER